MLPRGMVEYDESILSLNETVPSKNHLHPIHALQQTLKWRKKLVCGKNILHE